MTYAIIRTGGKQYRAEPGKTVRIPSLQAEAGDSSTFDEVLLGSDGTKVFAGAPLVSCAKVRAEVVRHGRADKIVGCKVKRRSNYGNKQGHRRGFTEGRIH